MARLNWFWEKKEIGLSNIDIQCFVIMPFLAELNYFYLYMKRHIEEKYDIKCLRADEKILTIAILDKINKIISESDIIIADCSGRNANVMYELGIAHAHMKNVILLTKDDISTVPSDIRHYEFINIV